MARNEEKAMTMLNRWVKQKQEIFMKNQGITPVQSKVPNDPNSISNLMECEEYRKKVES